MARRDIPAVSSPRTIATIHGKASARRRRASVQCGAGDAGRRMASDRPDAGLSEAARRSWPGRSAPRPEVGLLIAAGPGQIRITSPSPDGASTTAGAPDVPRVTIGSATGPPSEAVGPAPPTEAARPAVNNRESRSAVRVAGPPSCTREWVETRRSLDERVAATRPVAPWFEARSAAEQWFETRRSFDEWVESRRSLEEWVEIRRSPDLACVAVFGARSRPGVARTSFERSTWSRIAQCTAGAGKSAGRDLTAAGAGQASQVRDAGATSAARGARRSIRPSAQPRAGTAGMGLGTIGRDRARTGRVDVRIRTGIGGLGSGVMGPVHRLGVGAFSRR